MAVRIAGNNCALCAPQLNGFRTTATLPRTCSHAAEKKSIYRFPGPWAAVFSWSLGPSGHLFSSALHFRQSGQSIERLDFNQRPLLISVFATGPVTNAGPASSTPPHLRCSGQISLQVVTDTRRWTPPHPHPHPHGNLNRRRVRWLRHLSESSGEHLGERPAVPCEGPAGAAAADG